MPDHIHQPERHTQQRVVAFFQQMLGYRYLGYWKERDKNRNIEETLLTDWLTKQGHDQQTIGRVIHKLTTANAMGGSTTLYAANKAVYDLLRYGVKIQPAAGEHHQTVWLIDWHNSNANDFAIAEEVTLAGNHTKRPDIVLYINGIAIGALELKRSTVSVSEGIRQNLDNQKKAFIESFFTTVQLVLAGNDTEGLRYATIETPEKHWLAWHEEPAALTPNPAPWGCGASAPTNPLDRDLGTLCRKDRLLEIIHDFIVFDAGRKKTCRHNQYFAVRAAQEHITRRRGGIIWNTQGSGKSLIMVWLARWIREHITDARVLIITDRTELDDQIHTVFNGVNEHIYRTTSGADLVNVLGQSAEWLICSLVHKFGRSDDGDIEGYISDISRDLPPTFYAPGNIFVFVDECHRTQSGKLHQAMKRLLPNALLIGFTGTPLLKADKQKSIEVFGPYIHTYKYNEAVRDGVVLDLRYEARDIDQHITSQDRINQWFEAKTRGLSDFARAQLKQRWGTMQKLLSSQNRLEKIVADILLDMEMRDRLMSGRGNALLVSSSVYSACKFYELFDKTPLAGKCAIITSYKPTVDQIKGEESGEGMTEKLRKYDIYRKMLANHFGESEDTAANKVDQFESEVKKRFIEQPGQMRLLIVVDKLLTGFDAPPATYLYIDKQMRDHGLFQAICRVNRLDGDDKEYGYIVDYKDLFKSLEQSMRDYTSEAFDGYDAEDVDGLLQDRLQKGRERLEEVRESLAALCEPVAPPRDEAAYQHFFCGNSADPTASKATEPTRVMLYKLVASLLRAYANLANEMSAAGYSADEAQRIKDEVTFYENLRQQIKIASGDYVDMKQYEPAMRHLLDAYIRADDSEKISAFDDMTLVELIVERGEAALDLLPKRIRQNAEAMAEAIEHNVRRIILDEMALNPKYYEKMSELLDTLIQARKNEAIEYKAYLAQIVDLTRSIHTPETRTTYPAGINTPARRALYDNLGQNEAFAVDLDTALQHNTSDNWRGNLHKEREVRKVVREVRARYNVASADTPTTDDEDINTIMDIVRKQHDY